jgi:hypothetical protein
MPLQCDVVGGGEDAEFRCFSFGPDRVNDHGQGDDISAVLRNGSLVREHGWDD